MLKIIRNLYSHKTRSFSTSKKTMVLHALQNFDKLRELTTNKECVVFLDYDGTLSPIVPIPDDAIISDECRDAVRKVILDEIFLFIHSDCLHLQNCNCLWEKTRRWYSFLFLQNKMLQIVSALRIFIMLALMDLILVFDFSKLILCSKSRWHYISSS